MKRTVALLLAASLALLCGCAKQPVQESILPAKAEALNIQLGAEPLTLDPTFCQDPDTATYISHLFEGLTTLNENGEVVPGAAKSWEITKNDEGLPVITFTLDEAARWSDGQAVEAKDFVYAWERALNPATESPEAYQLYPIKGARAMKKGEAAADEKADAEAKSPLQAEAVDESTLKVTLEGDYPYFLELCASSPVYFPLREDVVTQHPETWTNDSKTLIGNGAYTLAQWTHDGSIRMIQNDRYRAAEAISQPELNFVLTADADAVYAAFEQGQLQFADTLSLLKAEEAKEKGVYKVLPRMGAYALMFNTKSETVKDAQVRQALSLSIDRATLAADVLADGSIPAGALVPEGVPGSKSGQDFRTEAGSYCTTYASGYAPQLQIAKELLKEAGHENGKGLSAIRFLTTDTEGNIKIAEAIKAMWASVGIKTEIMAVSWNDYATARNEGDFDVARYSFAAAGHTDPLALLDLWVSNSTLNLAGYKNDRFDALIAAAYSGEEIPAEKSVEEKVEETKEEPEATKPADGTQQAEKTPTEEEKAEAEAKAAQAAADAARAQRMSYLHEAEGLLVAKDAVVVPLYFYPDAVLYDYQLSGVVFSPLGTRWFGHASWQK